MAEANALKAVEAGSDLSQIVSFIVGKELFGIGIDRVKEIVRYPEITSVPRAPAYLTGLANLRGNVLPVIDARVRLNLPQSEITDSSRVLVIDTGATLTGVIVDAVRGVINMENVSIEPPPSIIASGVDTRYINSVIKLENGAKLVMELDIDALCVIESQRGQKVERLGRADDQGKAAVAADNNIHENQLVTFLVANEEYGLPIESVREVLRVGRITEVPEAPPYVLGIFSVRNTLLPIVDIRRLFAIPSIVEDMGGELDTMRETHQNWIESLKQSLGTGMNFTGEQDPGKCDLGKFLDGYRTSSEEIGKVLQEFRIVHQGFHALAGSLTEARRVRSLEEALKLYESDAMPLSKQLWSNMENMKHAIRESIKEDQRILVVEVGKMPVGILVDRMQQVIRVPENIIDPPPGILSTGKSDNLKGIVKLQGGKRLILLLDEDKVLTSDKTEVLQEMASGSEIESEAMVRSSGNMDEIQLVTFKLGKEEFAIGIDDVQEINRLENITSVPRAPSFVEGVMNLRGNVVPAIDLRKRFGLENVTHNEQTRVIIVTMGGKLTGFVVDSVSEVLRLGKKSIEPPPDILLSNLDTKFIKGVGKFEGNSRMILLIDISKILTQEEQMQLDLGKHVENREETVASPASGSAEPKMTDETVENELPPPIRAPKGLKKAR